MSFDGRVAESSRLPHKEDVWRGWGCVEDEEDVYTWGCVEDEKDV